MTIDECITALVRDRREPDKVLLNVASLRRALDYLRNELLQGDCSQEALNMLYVDPSMPVEILRARRAVHPGERS